jgi:predicted TIM-barrel fold metal-dependent hydrolase
MQNHKTRSSAPKPVDHQGWVRKSELDAYLGRHLPVPTQVVSNGEFYPLPQTREQRAVERLTIDACARAARRLRVDRHDYLRTSCGMASAISAMNQVFGDFFAVNADETTDPLATDADRTDYFIFDVQTHHVVPGHAETKMNGKLAPIDLRRTGAQMIPELAGEVAPEDLYLQNYVKEVFLDSETDVACITGVPAATEDLNTLPYAEMVRTRDWINRITKSQRMVSHGLLMPDLGVEANRERMQVQAENLKIDAWKGYTGLGIGKDPRGWWADDEQVSYPALEYSRKLGVRNICLHKGLALGLFDEEHCHPRDIAKAARDFPDLNFLLYHSGFKSLEESLPAAQDQFRTTAYVPWVSDLCQWRKANPGATNIYMEIGGTFGITAITSPVLCCHVLGMIIDAFGADHVLWGTDSIWLGSPRWQIEMMRRLRMPQWMTERFGYAPLTVDVKRQIFGLNAAKLYGIEPSDPRHEIPDGYLDELRRLYESTGLDGPSNTQYGWVRTPN